jgi:hypothetical protein
MDSMERSSDGANMGGGDVDTHQVVEHSRKNPVVLAWTPEEEELGAQPDPKLVGGQVRANLDAWWGRHLGRTRSGRTRSGRPFRR